MRLRRGSGASTALSTRARPLVPSLGSGVTGKLARPNLLLHVVVPVMALGLIKDLVHELVRAIYIVGKPSNLLAYFFRFLGPNCAQKLIVSHSASRQATQRQMARLLTNQPYKLALRQEIIMEFMRTEPAVLTSQLINQ